jgi:orotate phosphoribosyltransferase
VKSLARQVAGVLLEIEAVKFSPFEPLTFKSGLKSPIYVDNRRLPYWPHQWTLIIEGFQQLVQQEGLVFDVIAGIETAGIPHSAALAYSLKMPSVFVRKQPKEHGTRSRVEGGAVAGKHVLLIEDMVTTGSSSLAGVDGLREVDAQVSDCLAIISYGFSEARERFAQANMHLHTLTTFADVLAEAVEGQCYTAEALTTIEEWLDEPYGWAERHGFA